MLFRFSRKTQTKRVPMQYSRIGFAVFYCFTLILLFRRPHDRGVEIRAKPCADLARDPTENPYWAQYPKDFEPSRY